MATVLFATEYESANIILNTLCEIQSEYHIFPLLMKLDQTEDVAFCLQTQLCENSVRMQPVFFCHRSKLPRDLSKPLTVSTVSAALNIERTKILYKVLLTEAGFWEESFDRVPLQQFMFCNKETILKFLREYFLMPTSPAWFTSTYGMHEGVLILTMAYYLFERQYSTIQTTQQYVRCFTAKVGKSLMGCFSFREFAQILFKSQFAEKIPRFFEYASQKNKCDKEELKALDCAISSFRNQITLTDTEHVHFIYLAYGVALQRTKFAQYTAATSHVNIKSKPQNILCKNLEDDLLSIMRKYFNLETYLNEYVKSTFMTTENAIFVGYNLKKANLKMFSGTSNAISMHLKKANKALHGIFEETTENISGFIEFASCTRKAVFETDSITKLSVLLPEGTAPLPVFRVDCYERSKMSRIFCIIASENWEKELEIESSIARVSNTCPTNEVLTSSVWLPELTCAAGTLNAQIYISRHEIFNEHLPIYNFIGDFDIPLKHPIDKKWIFSFCEEMRETILTVFSAIFKTTLDHNTHPVYFFKTACEESDFCCTKKLGMRIICPFPSGTAVIGGKNMKTLCSILDHAIFLKKETFNLLSEVTDEKTCFDSGIYNHGRSIRVPLMYKVDEAMGFLSGRLKPIFIIPPHHKNHNLHKEFVREQLALHNMLHHAPHGTSTMNYFTCIEDVGKQENHSFIDSKYNKLYNRVYFDTDVVIENMYQKTHWTTRLEFIEFCIWPQMISTFQKTYSEQTIEELSSVLFDDSDWPCVQLYRLVNGCKRHFHCLKHDHRDSRDNVNVFLDIRADGELSIWCTLWSRCFARKCNSNAKQVHLSHKIKFHC